MDGNNNGFDNNEFDNNLYSNDTNVTYFDPNIQSPEYTDVYDNDLTQGYQQDNSNLTQGYQQGNSDFTQGYQQDDNSFGYDQNIYSQQPGLNLDFNAPRNDNPQAGGVMSGSSMDFTGVDENFAKATESTLESLGGELTPAEIADMKREKAARRRKQMLREKKRRERMRQAIIRCTLLVVAVIFVIVIIVKIFAGIGSLIKGTSKKHSKTTEEVSTEATTTEEPVATIDEEIIAKDLPSSREEALTILKEQGETDSDIKNIVENEAVYPDIMLKNLAINSELIDFALNYPAKINIPFDGDFSVDVTANEMPLFMEYDQEWGYADYGDTVLGLNGAAPSCLSMAYVYLTGDGSKNPIIIGDFSMANGYLNEDGTTDYKLMSEGAEELGLESNELDLDKENIIAALEEGNAIICAVTSGDFTKNKSYIVISDYRNGFFYINDPTSRARSQVGWDYKRLSSQIASMWSLKRGTAAISTDDADGTTDTDGTDGEQTDGEQTDGTDDGNADGAGDNSQTDNGGADAGTE